MKALILLAVLCTQAHAHNPALIPFPQGDCEDLECLPGWQPTINKGYLAHRLPRDAAWMLVVYVDGASELGFGGVVLPNPLYFGSAGDTVRWDEGDDGPRCLGLVTRIPY